MEFVMGLLSDCVLVIDSLSLVGLYGLGIIVTVAVLDMVVYSILGVGLFSKSRKERDVDMVKLLDDHQEKLEKYLGEKYAKMDLDRMEASQDNCLHCLSKMRDELSDMKGRVIDLDRTMGEVVKKDKDIDPAEKHIHHKARVESKEGKVIGKPKKTRGRPAKLK